ncbi:Mss4-like protein [Phlyctochytrium arcticum]|nr:Mss4-like protein [Phlyctochytrium arcticum]KAI9104615.1 Mss4-like protein [Phlyctochytrium arcticum]
MAPISGKCHCGAFKFTIPNPPTEITRCNCTFCYKRGVLWAYFPAEQVTLTREEDGNYDAVYESGNPYAQHHHCQKCGCGTYSNVAVFTDMKLTDKKRISINALLLDDFDISQVKEKKVDGRNDNWT